MKISISLKILLIIQNLLVLSPKRRMHMIRIEITRIEVLDRGEVFLCRV